MAFRFGNRRDNFISGTDNNDLIFAFGGDDTIYAGDGNDWIFGGWGFDSALFDGSVLSYDIDEFRRLTIVEQLDADGNVISTDRLFGVEALQFDDYTFFTDGRDNAVFITGDQAGAVTEDDTDTATGTLVATDFDGDDTIVASSGSALFGSFEIDAQGNWTYVLDNANPAVQALDAGETLTDSFDVFAEDGTVQTIEITINGADEIIEVPADAPLIVGDTDVGQLDVTTNVSAAGDVQIPTGSISGSTITATDGIVGNQNGSEGFVVVAGQDAELSVIGGQLIIGNEGTGTVSVRDGGTVTVDNGNRDTNNFIDLSDLVIGGSPTGEGTLEITGAGSTVRTVGVDNSTRVGLDGGDGTLLVEDGGRLESIFFEVGRNDLSTGRVVVSGEGSEILVSSETGLFAEPFTYEAGFAVIGRGFGATATLEILDGGRFEVAPGRTENVETATPILQVGRDGSHAEVLVDGVGSVLSVNQTIPDPTYAGPIIDLGRGDSTGAGRGGSGVITVSNGGLVEVVGENGFMQIGQEGEGTLNILEGGQLTFEGLDLNVGQSNTGNLNISDGGNLSFEGRTLLIGQNAEGMGNITVSGAGSQASFLHSGNAAIGFFGDAELNVLNGAQVNFQNTTGSVGAVVVGEQAGSSGSVLVDGLGTELNFDLSSFNLVVGVMGEGDLSVTSGGTMNVSGGDHTNVLVGGEAGSTGEMLVSGPGSEVNIDVEFSLAVGFGGDGSLSVLDGGTLNFVAGPGGGINVGSQPGSTGEVIVSGANSVLDSSFNNFSIGLSGEGLLEVSDGGLVRAREMTVLENGTVTGDGTIEILPRDGFRDLLSSDGTIAPGDGIGTLTVLGDVETTSTDGTLEIEIGGTSNHDVLAVSESFSAFEATLSLDFQGSFAPSAGDTFQFITAGDGATGSFGAVIVEGLAADASFGPIVFDGDGVSLTFLADATAEDDATIILGSDGSEAFDAGAGNDLLNGGGGDDTLTGGDGADVFAFSTGSGFDEITDFESGQDLIDLSGYGVTSLSEVEVTFDAVGATIDLDGPANDVDAITLLGVGALGVDDFIFA